MSEGRAEVVATAQALARSGLCVGTSGNVSLRVAGGFLITPTGVPYEDMRIFDVVLLAEDGEPRGGRRAPSSEWRLHAEIYRARPDALAIVHTHSREATALSCTRRGLPAFHYLVARAGGPDIRCAAYATYGSAALAVNAVLALEGRRACLLANHGVVTLGQDLRRAFVLAEEVEELAAQYARAQALGGPVLLDAEEMARVAALLGAYGQPR